LGGSGSGGGGSSGGGSGWRGSASGDAPGGGPVATNYNKCSKGWQGHTRVDGVREEVHRELWSGSREEEIED
jgi:hypothetical protein